MAVVVGTLFLLAIFLTSSENGANLCGIGRISVCGGTRFGQMARFNRSDSGFYYRSHFSITDGIALGFISYVLIKLSVGRYKELNLVALAFYVNLFGYRAL